MKEKDEMIESLQNGDNKEIKKNNMHKYTKSIADTAAVFAEFDELNKQLHEYEEEEAMWYVNMDNAVLNKNKNNNNITEDEMKQVFDEFDTDGSGSIDNNELYQALIKMSSHLNNNENYDSILTMDKVNNLVSQIDLNNDGEIDFEEFQLLFTQSWFINMHENRLAKSIQRLMSTASLINIEDVSDYDEDDDGDVKVDTSSLSEGEQIKRLKIQMKRLKESYDKEIKLLKEQLENAKGGKTNDANEPLTGDNGNGGGQANNPCVACKQCCIVM